MDEDACVAVGWLMSKGWKLYSEVFSHHMPLDYLPSWAIASLFGPAPRLCRAFMMVVWAGACGGMFALLSSTRSGALRAALFTLLTGLWMTYWGGSLLLVENYWAYTVVLLIAMAEVPPNAARATAAGALLSVLLGSSLTCAPAFLILAFALMRQAAWRKSWRPMLGGFAACALLLLLWSWRHADLSLWYEDAVRFNSVNYTHFSMDSGWSAPGFLLRVLASNAAYFGSALSWTDLERCFEGLLKLAVLGWVARLLWRRRWVDAAQWTLLILALRLRQERAEHLPPIHSAPYFLAATWLVCREAVLVWGSLQGRWPRVWVATCALLLATTLAPTTLVTLWIGSARTPNLGDRWLTQAVRSGTDPQDPIAALPMRPRLYLDAERVPATPGVFYFPWQAAWHEQHARVLAALIEHPPKVVALETNPVWGIAWKDFGGDIDLWVRAGYLRVVPSSAPGEEPSAQLFVRKDYAAEFARRCPDCSIRHD